VRDEGEAFLALGDEPEERDPRGAAAEALHPGLDAAFKHVEKLEQNMLRKSVR